MIELQQLLKRLRGSRQGSAVNKYLFNYTDFAMKNCTELKDSQHLLKFRTNTSSLFNPHPYFMAWADVSQLDDDKTIALMGHWSSGKSTLAEVTGRVLTYDASLIVFVNKEPYLVLPEGWEMKICKVTSAYGIIPVPITEHSRIVQSSTKLVLEDVNPGYMREYGFNQKGLNGLSTALNLLQEMGLPSYYFFNSMGISYTTSIDKIDEAEDVLKRHALGTK